MVCRVREVGAGDTDILQKNLRILRAQGTSVDAVARSETPKPLLSALGSQVRSDIGLQRTIGQRWL